MTMTARVTQTAAAPARNRRLLPDARSMAWLTTVAVMMIGLAGCQGYRLGTSLPPDITSICVRPAVNQTAEPGLETIATTAAVREFQKDGSLSLADMDKADVVLEMTMVDFRLEPLRYSKDRATETLEFRLVISANAVLKSGRNGAIISTYTRLSGKTDFAPSGDLASAKRRAIPAAALDLAHAVVGAVVEAW